jgi:uncharacterized membrane protein YdjX (TVP38/TMEM64 family)
MPIFSTGKNRIYFFLFVTLSVAFFAFYFRGVVTFDFLSVKRISRGVELAHSNKWITALFYLIFVFGVMALPITLFPIVGGILCHFWLALPLNVLAATSGAWFSFLITRRFGRRAVEPFLRGKIKSWEQFSSQQGFKTIFLLRLVGVPPFIVSNYALGLSGVSHDDFLLGTAFGILPWMSIVTYAAGSLWQAVLTGGEKGLSHALFHALAPLMVISVGMVIGVGTSMILRRRKARIALAQAQAHSNL